MAKSVPAVTTDTLLAKIATCTRQTICSAQPANFAGIGAVALADNTITAGSGNGDWLIAAGDAGGESRKVTLLAQTGIVIDASGTASHIAHDDGSTLLWVTTCTNQALVAAGTVDIPAYKHEVAGPT